MSKRRSRQAMSAEQHRRPFFPTRMRRKKTLIGKVRFWSIVLVLAWLVAGVCLTLPLRWFDPPLTAFMLQDSARDGKRLESWLPLDELGDNLALAVVAAEDQRFDQHMGLDFRSIVDSVEDSKNGDRLRGASTLTQQLAKNLYLWPGRNFLRKGLEAWLAVNFEIFLPKRRILELYLNVVEFGPGIYGAAEASTHFFGRAPAFLTDRQAALLAAVLPSPRRYRANAPSAYVRERQDWILLQMARLKREHWLYTIR